MKPISAAEQLIFTTVHLQTKDGGSGTGYFFTYQIGNATVPIIVTNKHVVNSNPKENVKFILHLTDDGETASGTFTVSLDTVWHFHPTLDLCFTYTAEILSAVCKLSGKQVFYKSLDESMVYTEEELKKLSMIESVVMIGYPNALFDTLHQFPVFRYGNTAAHPGYDFSRGSIGLVDIACFPGSSGSPILILNQGGYWDKNSGLTLGKDRLIFLGTLFAGPILTTSGTIEVTDIPTTTHHVFSTQMLNLGYYIKAHTMKYFRAKIEEDMKLQQD